MPSVYGWPVFPGTVFSGHTAAGGARLVPDATGRSRNYRLGETALQTSTDNTFGAKVGDTQQLFAVGTTP
jgi:hypothetical protein